MMQSPGQGAVGLARIAIAVGFGIVTAFALFWVMQALIGVSGELDEAGRTLSVDFVRLRKDTTPPPKKREPPKREKPQQTPPPPQMNMAKAMNPGDAVGDIVPMVDTGAQLAEATAMSGGGGSDSDVVPLVRVDPEYPPRAKQQKIEGYVELEFTISPVGTIKDPFVIGADPPFVFDRAALRAIRRWRYNPKVEKGKAVERAGVQVRIRFTLPKGGR
jgi:protein TonB